jgi:hypothetical protein
LIFAHPVNKILKVKFIYYLFFKANEKWRFQLWEHIYSDRVEIERTINSSRTQTSIEIRLIKQQPRKTWPRLYSFDSIPITPQRDGELNEYEDENIIDEQQYDLSIKKIKCDFFESNQTFTSHFYIKQVHACQIHFTETNFTAIFRTEYEYKYIERFILIYFIIAMNAFLILIQYHRIE